MGKNIHLSVQCVLQKCAEYWPEDTVTHEGIEITVVTVTQEDDYSLRVFTLKVTHRKIGEKEQIQCTTLLKTSIFAGN